MSSNANVSSLDQLARFLEKSEHFRGQLIKETENLQVELRRITNWIEKEALDYWTQELRVAQRHFIQCQDALVRCMSYVREEERRPCTDEKKRLKRAQDRRSTCEQQLKLAGAAAAAWEQEQMKNSTKIQRCQDLAESNMLVAIHHLRGQLEILEAYANVKSNASPTTDSKPAGSPITDPLASREGGSSTSDRNASGSAADETLP